MLAVTARSIQLAGYLKQPITSGTFRLRVSNAATFGLTENERGEVRLTGLGRRIADAAQEAAARVDAFLNVPLYQRKAMCWLIAVQGNSLLHEKVSQIRVRKFPVLLRREFGCKPLYSFVDWTQNARGRAGICKFPC
jgi:hypothetical protein